mgnify:FL=1
MLRIPGPGRIEDRTIDSSCNPYLAAVAILAAGLDGMNNKLDPGVRNDTNMYQRTPKELAEVGIELLPTTLKEAVEELAKDKVILDAIGPEFCDYYINFKKQEWNEYHNNISQWELDKYLMLY